MIYKQNKKAFHNTVMKYLLLLYYTTNNRIKFLKFFKFIFGYSLFQTFNCLSENC